MVREIIATSRYSSKLRGYIVHMNDVDQDYFVSEHLLTKYNGSRLAAAMSRDSFVIPKE